MKRLLTYITILSMLLTGVAPVAHAQEIIPEVATLTELQTAIEQAEEGDTINVTQTIPLSEYVTVGKAGKRVKLVFCGEGVMFQVSGQGNSYMVYLQDLDIEGGSNGAVAVSDRLVTLFISGCNIEDFSGSRGGAVMVESGAVNLFQSTFTNCSASLGGALYLSSGTFCSIDQCSFSNNNSSAGGGAIYSDTSIEISNSTFTGNSAGSHGGAIYGFVVRASRFSKLVRGHIVNVLLRAVRSSGRAALNCCHSTENVFTRSLVILNGTKF